MMRRAWHAGLGGTRVLRNVAWLMVLLAAPVLPCRGEAPKSQEPRVVGSYSTQEKIVFEGNVTFTVADLYEGLMGSPDFLLATHPSAPFEAYPAAMADCLLRGYQNEGFPEAKVSVTYDRSRDAVVCRITEGKRYKWGTLQIRGAKVMADDALRAHLLKQVKEPDTFGSRLTAAVAGDLGKVLSNQSDASKSNELPITPATTDFKDVWKEGDWASLGEAGKIGLKNGAAGGMSTLGFFQSKAKVSHTLRPETGTVETLLEIEEGPRAVLSEVQLEGNKAWGREAILKFLGVNVGMEMTPEVKARVQETLARSMRFAQWSVDASQTAAGSPDMVLKIHVVELPGAPPLEQPLTADQSELVRAAEWLTMLDRGNEVITMGFVPPGVRNEDAPTQLVWGIDGMVLMGKTNLQEPANAAREWRYGMLLTPGTFQAYLRKGEAASQGWQTLVTLGRVEPRLTLYSKVKEDGKAVGALDVGAGWKSNPDGLPPVQVLVVLSPTELWHLATAQGATMKRENREGREMLCIRSGLSSVYWDVAARRLGSAEIALPEGAGEAQGWKILLGTEKDAWPHALAKVKSETGTGEMTRAGLNDWMALLSIMLKIEAQLNGLVTREQIEGGAVLADLAVESSSALWEKFKGMGQKTFSIPPNMANMAALDPTAAMMAQLWFYVTDAYFPKETWLWDLGREAFYIQAGRREHMGVTLDRIARDPALGPFGCLLAARLLDYLKEPQAMRFRQLALQKANREGLEADWKLITARHSGLNEVLGKVMARLRDLDHRKLGALVRFLGKDMEGTIRDGVAQLRARPDADGATVLWPILLKAWNTDLQTTVRVKLEQVPGATPADPRRVAARVNGSEILREEIRVTVQAQISQAAAQTSIAPTVTPAEHQKLEAAVTDKSIERQLVIQGFRRAGGEVPEAVIDQDIQNMVQTTYQGNQTGFELDLVKNGVTLVQFREFRRNAMILNAMMTQVQATAKPPTEKELRAAYEKEFATVKEGVPARLVELHTLTLTSSESEPSGAVVKKLRDAAEKLRSQLQKGGSFEALAKAHSKDGRAESGGGMGEVAPGDLSPVLRDAVARMKAGEVSEVLDLGGSAMLLWIKSEKVATPPSFEKERERLVTQLTQAKRDEAWKAWLQDAREKAYIERYEEPRG